MRMGEAHAVAELVDEGDEAIATLDQGPATLQPYRVIEFPVPRIGFPGGSIMPSNDPELEKPSI